LTILDQERSETVKIGERSGTVRNGERSEKVNGKEHLGRIESERSNALKRIVENGHGTVTVWSRSRIKNKRNTVFKKKIIFHVRCQKIFLLKKCLLKLLIMTNPAQKIIQRNLARSCSKNNPAKSCLFLPIIYFASTCKSIFLDPA
jgi:hypothetical protein